MNRKQTDAASSSEARGEHVGQLSTVAECDSHHP